LKNSTLDFSNDLATYYTVLPQFIYTFFKKKYQVYSTGFEYLIYGMYYLGVTSSHCVFFNKVLIIRSNTTYRSSTIVFYYTLHSSAVQRHLSLYISFCVTDINLMIADVDS